MNRAIFIIFIGTLHLISCQSNVKQSPQLTASPALQKALADFQIADDFKVELIAAEPLIADPVAMEIDENGVLYVVEMHGYPLDLSGSGLVKILKDTNKDGFPDKHIIFADSLILPTGIMKWQKGVLVTDPPHVWYFEDTDGDDVADIRKPMLTGFARSNPQHNLNAPVFGLDNWIYMAHQWAITPIVCVEEFSDEGSEIYFPEKTDAPRLPRNADDRNVRFRPDRYELEVLSGNSQFGHTFSPWGHQLLNENAHHLYHEVIADRYLRRNPNVIIPDVVQNIPDHGDACEVYPITQNPQHQLLTDIGVITSACGVTWYDGGAFPDPYHENITFVAEPVHNLIHVDKIADQGASFTASRVLENQDFMASKDANFRPCGFYIGPEGALYVIDYYRPIIEHPEWMSDEVNKSGKLYEGSNKGRIYRIVPEKGLPLDWTHRLNLGELTDNELIKYLEHKNIWYRRTAQRLLYQRKSTATDAIRNIALHAKSPAGRVHALWLLDGLNVMDEAILYHNLQHTHPGVRENAIKIAELYLQKYTSLQQVLLKMKADPHPKVRYQLLCTLGYLQDEAANAARLSILKQDLNDYWVQIAALTAAAGSEMQLFNLAIQDFKNKDEAATQQFFALLAATVGNANQASEVLSLLQKATEYRADADLVWQTAVLKGLRELWQYKGVPPYIGETEKNRLLQNFNTSTPASLRSASVAMLEVVGLPQSETLSTQQKATAWAQDQKAPEPLRVNALNILSIYNPAKSRPLFEQCIAPSEPESVQTAAFQALGSIPGTAVLNLMLSRWNTLTPDLKELAIGLCLKSPERMHRLLDAIAAGQIKASSVSWQRQVQLMNNDDVSVRTHARQVLTAQENSNRQQVIDQYKTALQGTGDVAKGTLVFERACQQCHRIKGKGVNFGPDLASIRNRDAYFILADILNPNRSIADAYEYWNIQLKNGTSEAGVIVSETSTAITVKNLAGSERTIARSEIRTLQALPTSIMPEGLENTISISEMRDLLAYLKKG